MSYIASPQRRQAALPPAALRRRIEAAVDRLIAALDAIDAPEEDLEDGHDREKDEAELSGIGDREGLDEQEAGEPSLGATLDIDQRVAWGEDRLTFPVDAEASGTEDDIGDAGLAEDDWKARRAAADNAKAQLRTILARRHAIPRQRIRR